MKEKTYFLDMFSGIGGFALAAYNSGLRFHGHYFSEIDEYAVKIYKKSGFHFGIGYSYSIGGRYY